MKNMDAGSITRLIVLHSYQIQNVQNKKLDKYKAEKQYAKATGQPINPKQNEEVHEEIGGNL